VAQAKGEGGFNMDIYATFGLTNLGNEIPDIYVQPQDQQSVRVGFDIPIVDWGRQKSVRNTAEANQKLVQYTVAQEEVNFDQEVITEVKQFDMLREQILITEKADEISQNRYDISQNRYLIGKISITDLNIALQDKDLARRTYVSSLRNFWTAYYNLRMLTLYDFATGTMLYTGE
jgi:outer membrane protein TolC